MKWITVFGCCPRGSTWINSNHLLSERLWQWFSDLTGVKLKFNSAIYIIIVIHPSIHIDDKNEDGDDDYSPAHVIKATLITRLQRWIPSTSPPDPLQISYPSLARHLNWLLWSWSLCLCVSAFHFAFGSHKIVRFVHLSYFRKDSFEISMPPPPKTIPPSCFARCVKGCHLVNSQTNYTKLVRTYRFDFICTQHAVRSFVCSDRNWINYVKIALNSRFKAIGMKWSLGVVLHIDNLLLLLLIVILSLLRLMIPSRLCLDWWRTMSQIEGRAHVLGYVLAGEAEREGRRRCRGQGHGHRQGHGQSAKCTVLTAHW